MSKGTRNAPEFLDNLLHRFPRKERKQLVDAYWFAHGAHAGQVRKSGEPYIFHPVAVAEIVANVIPDVDAVTAALLHDAIEDTSVTASALEGTFGEQVAVLVDGLTKLDKLKFETREAQQAATIRKMFVAMSRDIRVIIIKLADRLHNMMTLAALPRGKQERIAQETLDLYAPLAHRLGMQDVRQRLEDLSFATLYPKHYAEIDNLVGGRAHNEALYVEQVIGDIREVLTANNIFGDVSGRSKHYWSIYEKMVVKQKAFDDIHDLVGVRIVTNTLKDCYSALGVIHSTWVPIQGRFKDYIATPKFNLYQSLHTTVMGPGGKPIEVQIRTREMHLVAEHGVAAHWEYKARPGKGGGEKLPWLSTMLDWQQETSDPDAFMAMLKVDLEQDEVFVFTPAGKVVTLPSGSTPVDFAYAIHTEVGDLCVGAKINGKLSPLSARLASGDTVEIITGKAGVTSPSQDWLKFVATSRAKGKIRQWYSRERREESVEAGQELLWKALRKEGLPVKQIRNSDILNELAKITHHSGVESLFAAVGGGHVSAESLSEKVRGLLESGDLESGQQLPVRITKRNRSSSSSGSVGVHVEGMDDIMIRFAQCCHPLPGEPIIGYVTKGQGVSIHTSECTNVIHMTEEDGGERVVDVNWDVSSSGVFEATLEVKALDRTGLLGDIAASLSASRTNIVSCATITDPDLISTMRFVVQLSDTNQLEDALRQVKVVESVYDAYRING